MNKQQLRELIIAPVLKRLGLFSEEATELLVGTAGVESNYGEFIKQVGSGPALGIYQMEPATARDIYDNYLKYKPELKGKVDALRIEGLNIEDNIIGNLYFATALCRIHYLRVPISIPKGVQGLAEYWKKYYNTTLGKGTVAKFVEAYKR